MSRLLTTISKTLKYVSLTWSHLHYEINQRIFLLKLITLMFFIMTSDSQKRNRI